MNTKNGCSPGKLGCGRFRIFIKTKNLILLIKKCLDSDITKYSGIACFTCIVHLHLAHF